MGKAQLSGEIERKDETKDTEYRRHYQRKSTIDGHREIGNGD